MTAGSREDRPPEQIAFRRFLVWLDGGEDSGGQKYLEMHRRLASYFDRKNCPSPEDLADETLSRVNRHLAEEGSIQGVTLAQYCYVTARFVFLEHLYFAPLAGAAQEARAIQSLFPEAQQLAGPDATGSALKRLDAPDLLHIATHGFFLPAQPGSAAGNPPKPL